MARSVFVERNTTDRSSPMSLPSFRKCAKSVGLGDLASTITPRWRPQLRPRSLGGCEQRRCKSKKAYSSDNYTQATWSPFSEPVLGKKVKAVSEAYNFGTYFEVRSVRGQDLAKAPFNMAISPRHCYTRQAVMKYFGVQEHPLTDMFLYHYTSRKHRPLWIYVHNTDVENRPIVKTVSVKRLRDALVKVLNENGYGHWGDRLPGYDDTSVLHGTIHLRIQHGREFVRMTDQQLHDELERLVKTHVIKSLQIPQWPIPDQSRRIRGGGQSPPNRNSNEVLLKKSLQSHYHNNQQQYRGSGQSNAGGCRDTREPRTGVRSGNQIPKPRAENGATKSNESRSRVQQLADQFRTRR
ncbi:hypothetical protein B0T20DRAFT_483948 [Sordaria brevicollis]|uniref:Uncharacterized protein n=1 Tax=Sordaria brevicollis TaxID=83679 RepID=A0AAE0NWS1_SORBR|nr:hypothetical protein B0T20DRAFT_483948 [Sordaria brevicollis]